MRKYVCRESFGPFKKGDMHDTIPEEFVGTGVFVAYEEPDEPTKDNAAPILKEGK